MELKKMKSSVDCADLSNDNRAFVDIVLDVV
jgi:hypothetical protein